MCPALCLPTGSHDDSLYFQSWNRNKRSVTLDIRKPKGVEVFHDLVKVADVVFNNLRGDQPARLGLNCASLSALNPKIVCCSLNGFGSQGPSAAEPGYDYLMQAMTGYMSITGDPAGRLPRAVFRLSIMLLVLPQPWQ